MSGAKYTNSTPSIYKLKKIMQFRIVCVALLSPMSATNDFQRGQINIFKPSECFVYMDPGSNKTGM